MSETQGLTSVLQKVSDDCEGEELSVGDILAALENRGYGPLLLMPAMMTVLPTGTIPGVPTATAVVILIIAPQILLGRKSPWIPGVIKNKSMAKSKYDNTFAKSIPYTRAFDRLLSERLTLIVSGPAVKVIAAICIFLALSLPPLELVPGAAIVPAISIAALGLGLTARDGVLIVIAAIVLAVGGVSTYMLLA